MPQRLLKMEELKKRKLLRLKDYDYSSAGAYFITICTHNRKNTLSHIVGAIHESPEPKLTEYGMIIDNVIQKLPTHLKATIDRYVIMPNHVHMIIVIADDEVLRAIRESPLRTNSGKDIVSLLSWCYNGGGMKMENKLKKQLI